MRRITLTFAMAVVLASSTTAIHAQDDCNLTDADCAANMLQEMYDNNPFAKAWQKIERGYDRVTGQTSETIDQIRELGTGNPYDNDGYDNDVYGNENIRRSDTPDGFGNALTQ